MAVFMVEPVANEMPGLLLVFVCSNLPILLQIGAYMSIHSKTPGLAGCLPLGKAAVCNLSNFDVSEPITP